MKPAVAFTEIPISRKNVLQKNSAQGSIKVPSGCLGQEDFPSGQVAFHTHLGVGYRSDKLSVNYII